MKTLINIFSGIILLGSLNGCVENWLDENPNLTFHVSNIQTTKDLEKIVNGAYYTLSSDHNALQDSPAAIYTMMSDNVSFLSNNPYRSNTSLKLYNRETGDNNIDRLKSVWETAYKVINQANIAISFVKEKGKPGDDYADQLNRILGEAYFLRAYGHFRMVQFFAPPYDKSTRDKPGIILKNKASKSGEGKSVSTVGEVYDQIVSDLQKAMNHLPEKYDPSKAHPADYKTGSRVKKDAARFLLAKVYFQMGKGTTYKNEPAWDKALPLMKTVLDNPKGIDKRSYSLGAPKDYWLSYPGQKTPDEVVWEYSNIEWKNQKIVQLFMANNSTITGATPQDRTFPVSEDLLNAADWKKPNTYSDSAGINDKRYKQLYVFLTPEKDLTKGNYFQSLSKSYIWANMFAGYPSDSSLFEGYRIIDGRRYENSSNKCNIKRPFFRIGELLLLRATINKYKGNETDVKKDMDKILKRAGLNSKIKAKYTMDEIVLEHRRETAFEGRRINYLKALRREIPAGDDPANDPNNTIQRQDLSWNSEKLIWPIPQDEEIRNPNLYK